MNQLPMKIVNGDKTKLIVTVAFWLMFFFIGLTPYILIALTGDKYVTYNTRTKANETTIVTEETTTAIETTIADKIIIETTMAETADTSVESTEFKDLYDSQFKNDFVTLTEEYDAEIFSDWDLIASKDGTNSLVAGVLIENNEDVVNGFLDKIKTLINDSDECDSAIITIGDKSKGEDGDVLLVASIEDDEIQTSMESINYNSARNKWIREQFSAWDGSHREMTKLIKKSLNDEASYKHIETTYRDIKTQADADEVNKVLSSAGKNDTVQVGDLFIVTQFSAKNGFNATIKNTAYGIASYDNNSIKLIAIE